MKKYLLLSIMLLLFVTGCFSSKSVEIKEEAQKEFSKLFQPDNSYSKNY